MSIIVLSKKKSPCFHLVKQKICFRYPHKKRFNHQDMNDIEQGAAGSGLTPMHLLLDEWGTMGKTRFPNVKGGLIL